MRSNVLCVRERSVPAPIRCRGSTASRATWPTIVSGPGRARSSRQIPAVDTASAERSVVRRETIGELGRALLSLPAVQCRTIVLHDVQGYSNAEIATLDHVPYHTVRTRLNRARRALRIALGPMAA
jgi:DNA-directed RNA polymerase specialized sigma24 family protein